MKTLNSHELGQMEEEKSEEEQGKSADCHKNQ
jgi:hypothetical protein